jgi:hypothetical protein
MAKPQSTYALDRRSGSQPAWLDDLDLEDDPASAEWPFERITRYPASLEYTLAPPRAERSATVPPPRRGATVSAMAIATVMIVTFGAGWWVGMVHPARDHDPSVMRTTRSSARAVRAEADVAPATLAIATAPQAPAVPVPRWSPLPAPVSVAPVASVAPVTSLVPLVFVPSEL